MDSLKPGVRCPGCCSYDFNIFNSNILQCNACLAIDNLLNLVEDYFHCLGKLVPGDVYSRRDILRHTGFDLNNYAYTKLTSTLFEKVSARKYKFTGMRD